MSESIEEITKERDRYKAAFRAVCDYMNNTCGEAPSDYVDWEAWWLKLVDEEMIDCTPPEREPDDAYGYRDDSPELTVRERNR